MSKSQSMKLKIIESMGLKELLLSKLLLRVPKQGITNVSKLVGYKFQVQFDMNQIKKLVFFIVRGKSQLLIQSTDQIDMIPSIITSKNSYCPVLYFQKTVQKQRIHWDSLYTNVQNGRVFESFISCPTQSPNRSQSVIIQPIRTEKELQSVLTNGQQRVQNNQQYQQVRSLILFSHGNASDLGDVYTFAQRLVQLYEINLLAYDYTGYGLGKNRFKPSETQIFEDLQNLISYATCQLGYHLHEIILWGFSLGSCPTVEMASRISSVGGVVLLAPLASLSKWVDETSNDDYGIYCNMSKIQAIKSPMIIIHGQKDSIIDINHSRMLYHKHLLYNQQSVIFLLEIADTNHNDLNELILKENSDIHQRLYEFIWQVEDNWEMIHDQQQNSRLEFQDREETLLKLINENIVILNDSLQYMEDRVKPHYYNDNQLNKQSMDLIDISESENSNHLCQFLMCSNYEL